MGTMGTEFGSRTWWQSALRLAAAFALVMAGLSICPASSRAQDSSAKAPTGLMAGRRWLISWPRRTLRASLKGASGRISISRDFSMRPTGCGLTRPISSSSRRVAIVWPRRAPGCRRTRTSILAQITTSSCANGSYTSRRMHLTPPTTSSAANIHQMNDFYNQYTVRDAWWKLTAGPLTLYTGNQIVVWGQSLAFRVGDVINPVDTNWNFGFANLEQSRIPQWMLHPILNLPDLGPLTSNFVEGVLIPGAQPIWNSCNHPDGRYYPSGDDGSECNTAGRVNNGFPGANHAPSARFDAHYTNSASLGAIHLYQRVPVSGESRWREHTRLAAAARLLLLFTAPRPIRSDPSKEPRGGQPTEAM